MANYVFIDPKLGGDTPTNTATVQLWPLGMTAAGADVSNGYGYGEFIYGRGAANVADGLIVQKSFSASSFASSGSTYTSVLPYWAVAGSGSSNSVEHVAVAMGAVSSTNVFGWFQVRGINDRVIVSNTTYASQYRWLKLDQGGSALAWTASNDVQRMLGAQLASSQSATGRCTVELNYPFCIVGN
jgi:hypothetical protein